MKTRNKSSPPVRGLRARQRGDAVAMLSIYVPPELAAATRTRAFVEGRTLSAVVSDALAASLATRGGQ